MFKFFRSRFKGQTYQEVSGGLFSEEGTFVKKILQPHFVVLEYGSGVSTLEFSKHVKEYHSIEHDRVWYERVSLGRDENFHLYYIPPTTPWQQGCDGTYQQFKEYVDYVSELNKVFDLVLIDGRARVECAKTIMPYVTPSSYVLIHDFDRPIYREALYYYKLIKMVRTLAVLKPRVPEIIHLGTSYGGWHIPDGILGPESICYSAGLGEDISFDVELVNRYGCRVHFFDPTPRAQNHFDGLIEAVRHHKKYPVNHNRRQHYRIRSSQVDKLLFHPFGLYNKDERMKFYAPKDPAHVSHSILNVQNTTIYFEGQCMKLRSIMKLFGHEHIDLLKIDIEGAETDVLENMVSEGVKPKIICVEFDEARLTENCERTEQVIMKLRRYGYMAIYQAEWTYTFLYTELILR
jgi:FkbM family methyltransferase